LLQAVKCHGVTGPLEPIELSPNICRCPWQTIVHSEGQCSDYKTNSPKVVGAPSGGGKHESSRGCAPGSSLRLSAKDNPMFVVYIFTQSRTSGHQIFTKFLPYLPKVFFGVWTHLNWPLNSQYCILFECLIS
jgi:hypothetical protein